MNASSIRRWGAARAAALLAALLMGPLAASAQVQVPISGGFSGPYESPQARRTSP